jgi:L-alanine-DL-glutamate epimerase-like enolase superfamily enzyme
MLIKRLHSQDHYFQFKNGEYVMSYVTQKSLNIRVLTLESDIGEFGWGEIVRKPNIDPVQVEDKETSLLIKLQGQPISKLLSFTEHLRLTDYKLRGLAFGLETAYYDLIARRENKPLYEILGGMKSNSVPEYYSASHGDIASVTDELTNHSKGWKVVQIKLGVDSTEEDIEQVSAALNVLTRDQILLADFNGALDVGTALSVISNFEDSRIIWEEPCLSLDENSTVAARSKKPVMFDQCLDSWETFKTVTEQKLAHSVCIKPALLGGLDPARRARDICIDAKMPMRIDGPWCGHIATASCLHLAVGTPSDLLIAGCDLRQPLELNSDWGGTVHLAEHFIKPDNKPGHNAQPPH